MITEVRAALFVLATLVIAGLTLMRHRRAIAASTVAASERLRRAAARLRPGLESNQGGEPDPRTANRYEEFGAVMHELSLRSFEPEAPDEAISSFRQAAEAFRAGGKVRKSHEIEIQIGLLLHDYGLRSIDTAKLRECSQVLSKFLAPRKGKWLFRLPREFYQAAQAGALANLGIRIGDDSLLHEALPLCAPSRKSLAKGKFRPPAFAVDSVAGDTLRIIGREFGDRGILIDSIEAARRAIEAKKKIGIPNMLASSQDELGKALSDLGELTRDPETVREATAAFEEALRNLNVEERPVSWGEVHINMGRALTVLGKLEGDPKMLSRALESYRDALDVISTGWAPFLRAEALDAMGETLSALAGLRNIRDIARLSAESHRKAEAILLQGDMVGTLARVRRNIEAAESLQAG